MLRHFFCLIFIALAFAFTNHSFAQAVTALDRYIQKPDPNYSWQILEYDNGIVADSYFIKMVSQKWRNFDEVDRPIWEHALKVLVPEPRLCNLAGEETNTAILLISGGSNPRDGVFDTDINELTQLISASLCMVVAELKQVPNQPLNFTDEIRRPRKEDALIAYSFNKFLETGDEEWPLLLPMTKAAVRAMDTLQALAQTELDDTDIDNFIVLGGSKRGWTSWLSAAVDPRIKGIIPISIDILNLNQQFPHHFEAYGFYAPAINDYLEYDLGCRLQSARGQALLGIVDPFSYRDRYTLPKLIINSAGDQFFLPDSSRFYFDALPGPKHLRYTANTDHAQGETEQIIDLFLNARSWIDDIKENQQPPQFDWQFQTDGSIRVQTNKAPQRVKLWQATNPNGRDFRLETIGPAWTATELAEIDDGTYIGFVPPPPQGYSAFFIELEFEQPALAEADHIFTTGVRVTPDTLPFAGQSCAEFPDFSNLWFNPRQTGQSLQTLQNGPNRIGGIWYLYDSSGNPLWVNFVGELQGNTATGQLLNFSGPALGAAWNNNLVNAQVAGNATLAFRSTSSMTLFSQLFGVSGRLELVPFERLADPSFSGIWVDPSRNGSSIQLLLRANRLGGAWYLYDENGMSTWVTFVGPLDNNRLHADLLSFRGPALGSEWDNEQVSFEVVGTVQLELRNSNSITFDYTLNNASGSLNLSRFRPPVPLFSDTFESKP